MAQSTDVGKFLCGPASRASDDDMLVKARMRLTRLADTGAGAARGSKTAVAQRSETRPNTTSWKKRPEEEKESR